MVAGQVNDDLISSLSLLPYNEALSFIITKAQVNAITMTTS
jgi:hypothetical protein